MRKLCVTSCLRRVLLTSVLLLSLTVGASAFDTSQDSGLLMLVSKTHPVSADYVPETVVLEEINDASNGMKMRTETAEAFTRMYADMTADGVTKCNVISAYRSYTYQKYLVDSKVEKRMANGASRKNAYNQVTMSTAPAGCSEHQLGLALDLSTGSTTSQSFANSAAGQWMSEHAWKYGFIRRYQEDKASMTGIVNEAWHYRYVGVPHAQIMVANNWCMEEYIAYLHQNGSYTLVTEEMTYVVYWTQEENTDYEDIIDLSRDNDGGWVITTGAENDPLRDVYGHWSETAFLALQERGVSFSGIIDPAQIVTFSDFAYLCGLDAPENGEQTVKREEAAAMLAESLPVKALAYLAYSDLSELSGSCFQGVQIAVSNGIFNHAAGTQFHPAQELTWGEAATVALRYREQLESAESGVEGTAGTTSDIQDTKEL